MEASNKDIESVGKWYRENRDFYKRLAIKVELIIKELLELESITYLSVESRAKTLESFLEKAMKDKYPDPISQITDLAGIRVITYFESDVTKVCEIIQNEFNIIPEHSGDKAEALDVNQVGYRSVHFVAEFSDKRLNLPEFKRFKGYRFEIQVRTILQHAWAEIEHDRGYKFRGDLPERKDIKRRFALLAGHLELADKEFDAIARDIDEYANDVSEDTKKGHFNVPIDTVSLREYLLTKLESLIKDGLETDFGNHESRIISELHEFGINTLQDLDHLITDEFINALRIHNPDTNFSSLLRELMIVSDKDRYFKQVYNKMGQKRWIVTSDGFVKMLEAYNLSFDELQEKYGLKTINNI